MDSNENQFSTFNDNDELSMQYYNQCESASWIKKWYQTPISTSMMSKDILGLYNFSQKILDLTDNFIKDLLNISNLESILTEDDTHFSIVDPSDCRTLNEKYQFLNLELPKYQRRYIKSQDRKDYIYLLNDVLRTLNVFVRPTLTVLERNITKLLFKVRRIKNQKLKIENIKVETTGNKINGIISEYLNQVHQTVTDLEMTDVPKKISNQKMRIEKMIKKTIDKKTNAMVVPVIDEVTTIEPSVKESYNLDQYIDPYEINDEDFEVGITESQAEMIQDQGNPFSHTIENYGQHVILEDQMSFNNDKFDRITADHNNASQGILSVSLIIGASSCVIVGLLAFLIIFGIMKYKKSKSKNLTENTHIRYLEDEGEEEGDQFEEYFIAK